jgi:hypothetical protein
MPRFLAFLRAIDVGGRTMAMSELCAQFVHACGLKKHSINEGQDLFYSPLEPNSGDKPQGDYMKVPIEGAFECRQWYFRLRRLAA